MLPGNTQHLLSVAPCFPLCLLIMAWHPLGIFNTPIISWHFPTSFQCLIYFDTPQCFLNGHLLPKKLSLDVFLTLLNIPSISKGCPQKNKRP